MYDDNFSNVNSSDVNSSDADNKEYDTEPTQPAAYNSGSSAVSSEGSYSGSNPADNAYSSNNASPSTYGSIESTGSAGSAYGSAGSTSTYGSTGNISSAYGSVESTGSTGSAYGSTGSTSGAYGSTGGTSSAYGSVGSTGSTYGSIGSTSNSYGSTGNTNSAYGSTGSTGSTYSTPNSGTWSNTPYRQSAGSYQYGSIGPGSAGNTGNSYSNEYAALKTEKKKKEKKKKDININSYFKKVLVSVSLGLFFGVCAGLGFYVVVTATGMFNHTTYSETSDYSVLEESADADSKDTNTVVSDSVNYSIDGSDIQKTQKVTTIVSDVTDVVKAVMPAVVSINNTYTERMSYFGQVLTNQAEASGSGIIVGKNDSELLIATNYHVIEDADKLTVQFVEDSEVEASVKGTDPDMDLAVIAVSLNDIDDSVMNQIAIATLGDSDELTVGEPAIAIGNSLGYGQSVTTGVISALNRDLNLSDGSTGTFIQTDAAINPGNSGGALLNIRGEVIGINSNKIGGSVVEGMGYAIPISAASPILAELMLKETKNKVSEDKRGFLGISGISVTAEVSSAYGMPEGVYIAQVYDGTAAAAAGLVKGDIITEFDGESVSSMEELQEILEYYAKGDTVEMTVMKVGSGGYHSTTVTITLGNKIG